MTPEPRQELKTAGVPSSTPEAGRKSGVPGTVEMAHVLFTDLVNYSLLPTDRQKEYLRDLQDVVSGSPRFRASQEEGSLIILPTGDGMALSFFGDPTAPVQCAVEVAAALKAKPHLKLRMGIHTGPVYRLADMNANANVAGGGINLAQRVMSCGDAGHILLSASMAQLLSELTEWAPALRDLGEVTVKHGTKLHLYSLRTDEVGNPTRPASLGKVTPDRRRWLMAAVGASVATAVGTGFWIWRGAFPGLNSMPSVAVLPFEDLSAQKDQTYFSDGVAEEVLNTLSKVPGLQVSGPTSSFRFRDRATDIREVGRQLGVDALLSGSIRRQGSRVRISTQLIKSADGFQIWANTFERELTDIFAIQEEIARAVASALKVTLLGGSFAEAARAANPEAHNAYLQGKYEFDYRRTAGVDKAISFFEQAVEFDPMYADAWVGLSEARSRKAASGKSDVMAEYSKAEEAVNHALSVEGNLASAYSARGWIYQSRDWDWARAEADANHALSLEPGNARLVSRAGLLYRMIGRTPQSVTLNRRAIALEPLSANEQYYAGMSFYYAGLNEDARRSLAECLRLVPGRQLVHWWLGKVALAQHLNAVALEEMQAETSPIFKQLGLTIAYHALGRAKQSQEQTDAVEKELGDDGAFYLAEVHAFRGARDKAIEWLEKSFALRQPAMTNTKGNPLFKPLESDPRYQALLVRLKL